MWATLIAGAFVVLVAATVATFWASRWLSYALSLLLLRLSRGERQDCGSPPRRLQAAAWGITAAIWAAIGAGLAASAQASVRAGVLLALLLPALGALLHPCWDRIKALPGDLIESILRSGEDKRGLDPPTWKRARQICFATKGRSCHIRLSRCTRVATQVDHIVPLARGGAKYDQDNLQPSCRHCNLSKGTKLMSELPIGFRRLFR